MPRKKATKKPIKTHREEVLKKDSSDNTIINSHKKDDTKYKQRMVESNWAKFDEDQFESNVSQVGRKFDALITQSGKDVSTFHFKDDQFMDYDKAEILQEEKKGILGFDLEQASVHLSNIPIFTKLGLQNVFHYLDNEGCKWHGYYLQILKHDLDTSQPELAKKCTNMDSELTWNFISFTNYEPSIMSLCKKIKETKVNIETVGSRGITNLKEEKLQKPITTVMDKCGTLSRIKAGGYDDMKLIEANDSNNDDYNDELDSLLATEALTSQSNTIPSGSMVSEVQRLGENAEKNILDKWAPAGVEDKPSSVKYTEKSEESLEEWLDSILD